MNARLSVVPPFFGVVPDCATATLGIPYAHAMTDFPKFVRSRRTSPFWEKSVLQTTARRFVGRNLVLPYTHSSDSLTKHGAQIGRCFCS
jgi:hypothetical protein